MRLTLTILNYGPTIGEPIFYQFDISIHVADYNKCRGRKFAKNAPGAIISALAKFPEYWKLSDSTP